ncbi:hypothetical protein X798_00908 [Onchocerca flexuosa]|uniref:GLE1 RNA export mediator n=1 Tax=Onchocerca flexuosa TaxID=387005 RepID=A0A238C498_9BILA|nr:hypothetical protein X798_00908 [Onchocerca flexuosa]
MSSRFGFHTNHFGISEEELDYDENDPSWLITSPGANVLHGNYESAKPFIEKIQQQQRAFLEEKLEERRELRRKIREKVSRDFDEKLKQHMAKFQPKPQEPLILELFLTQQKKELEESFRKKLGKSYVPESESVLGPLANISNSIPDDSMFKPAVLIESTSKSLLPIEASTSVCFTKPSAIIDTSISNMFSASSSVTVANLTSTVPSICDRMIPKIITSFPAHVTSTSPSSSYAVPKIQQQFDILSTSAFCPQKSSTLAFVSSLETLKGGHAVLTRTDSISSCRSSGSRSTSWSLQQIVEKEQSIPHDSSIIAAANRNESMTQSVSKIESNNSPVVRNGTSNDANVNSVNHCHEIYEHEINFARTFMANIANISDSVKNELKRTIKEKISVSTKKFAEENDIARIVRFFNNLLNGLTVYGFNDKMINLKNDKLARDWAMAHIIDTYLDLIPQDISLLKVVTAVLSSLTSSSTTFSKLLFGKLFIASPLLAVNHNECLECISNLKRRSDRFAETIVAWRSREIAIISLFIALKMSNIIVGLQTIPENNGLGSMWKMIALTASKNSPFGATLITEILKQHWNILHAFYGRQMEKLITQIDRSVLPFWRASLRKITPGDSEMNETIQSVAENCLTALKFTLDDCLSSFRP